MADSSTHARARYRQQRAGNITQVLQGNPTKAINMALERKLFPLISRVNIFKRAKCSSSLLRVDKKLLLSNRSILPSGKLCFLENTNLSNTSGHAISSEQRNSYKSTCSFPSLWLISVATSLVFGLSRHKVAHAAAEKGERPGPSSIKMSFREEAKSRR